MSTGKRFGAVGVVNTAVDVTLFALLAAPLGVVAANLVSTSAGMATSFVLHRRFTFRAPASARPAVTVVRFLAVTLAGLWVLQPLVLLAVVAALPPAAPASVALLVPKAFAIGVGLVWNFVGYRYLVFRSPRPVSA